MPARQCNGYVAVTDKRNLFQSLPAELAEEHFEDLLDGREFRLERIVSHGQASPADFWYDQEEHEWVLLVSGAATLHFAEGDNLVELAPGDHIKIPAHCRHRVAWTATDEATIWLAIFYTD